MRSCKWIWVGQMVERSFHWQKHEALGSHDPAGPFVAPFLLGIHAIPSLQSFHDK